MLNNPIRTFEHKRFGSMIDKDDGQVIFDFYATNIQNWLIRNSGELVMRAGLTARGTSPSQTNLGATVLYKSNGLKKFLRVIDGAGNTAKFQDSDDGSTWTNVTGGTGRTTGYSWALVQANDAIYGVNGTDTPIKYDGGSVTTIAAIPQGTAIEWWKNFLWVFGNPTFKDRLYFSNAALPETWTASDYINVNLGDSSNGIGLKGTAGSTGRLYAGKNRSIWFITGSSSATFVLQPLTYEFGTASHESMVQVKNDVWCIDLEGNVRKLIRTSFDTPFGSIASGDIQATVAGLNKSAMNKATAIFYNNYAMFFVPNGVDTYNSLVLVWDPLANPVIIRRRLTYLGGWIKFTGWNVARATIFQGTKPQLFLHDARPGNGQTYEWVGTSDNGIAITAQYDTKIYDFSYPAQQKFYDFSYQYANAQGNFTSNFYSSIDRFYFNLLAQPSLAGTGNKLLGQTWTLGVDKLGSGGFVKVRTNMNTMGGQNLGTTVQCRLEAVSSSNQVRLRQFTIHYYLRALGLS